MNLGAQLYSVRNYLGTREDTKMLFRACRDMGYENLQYSGRIIETLEDAQFLRNTSDESGIPIVVATFSDQQLTEQTSLVSQIMDILGAESVMVGVTPKEYRGSLELVEQFRKSMELPTQILRDKGYHIAYHNHAYEFKPLDGGVTMMDYYLEHSPDWLFMLDVCWAQYAGADPLVLMDKIGAQRLKHIHFKDTSGRDEDGNVIFCPCGCGMMELGPLAEKSAQMGVKDILVEQDNAAKLPDPLGEMEQSCKYLRKLLRKEG